MKLATKAEGTESASYKSRSILNSNPTLFKIFTNPFGRHLAFPKRKPIEEFPLATDYLTGESLAERGSGC